MKKFSFIFLCCVFMQCQQDLIEIKTVRKPTNHQPPNSFVVQQKDKDKSEEEDKPCSPPCQANTECKNGKCVGSAQTGNVSYDVKRGQSYLPVSTIFTSYNKVDPLAPN